MAIDYSHLENEAGMDVAISNARTRATTKSPLGQMWMCGFGAPTTYAATNQTLTAANLLTGIIIGTPTGASTYTFDSAANIIAAMNAASAGVQVGDILEFYIANDAAAANTITLAADGGATVTLNRTNNKTITQGNSFWFMLRVTAIGASPTCTVYW